MKVLCPIKRIVDYQVKIRIKPDNSSVDTKGLKMSINPFDEIALEAAIQLKENNQAKEIIAISIGSKDCEETLRHALAMGADRAILILTSQELDSLGIAKILRHTTQEESIDLVLMGKQAIDDDSNQTGQMLAALLDWPQGTFTSQLTIQDQQATVKREIDSGLETLSFKLPAVITTDLRLNTPRYISLPNIVKAKQKQIKTTDLETLGLNLKTSQKTLRVEAPATRKAGIKVESLTELFSLLTEKEKVFS